MAFNKACLGCGAITRGSRCPTCQSKQDRIIESRRGERPHYAGNYRKRAKQVRDSAVTCWLCGEGARLNDPWQADHVTPADPQSELAPAHRSCNIRRSKNPSE